MTARWGLERDRRQSERAAFPGISFLCVRWYSAVAVGASAGGSAEALQRCNSADSRTRVALRVGMRRLQPTCGRRPPLCTMPHCSARARAVCEPHSLWEGLGLRPRILVTPFRTGRILPCLSSLLSASSHRGVPRVVPVRTFPTFDQQQRSQHSASTTVLRANTRQPHCNAACHAEGPQQHEWRNRSCSTAAAETCAQDV